MIEIDLICESEHRPRIRLLKNHLQRLGIDLRMVDEVPASPPARLLVAPGKTQWSIDSNTEVIALHLDADTEEIQAAHHVQLQTWPARSSDREVLRLARMLRSNPASSTPGSNPDEASETRAYSESDQDRFVRPRFERSVRSLRNRARRSGPLLFMLGAFLGLYYLLPETRPTDTDTEGERVASSAVSQGGLGNRNEHVEVAEQRPQPTHPEASDPGTELATIPRPACNLGAAGALALRLAPAEVCYRCEYAQWLSQPALLLPAPPLPAASAPWLASSR